MVLQRQILMQALGNQIDIENPLYMKYTSTSFSVHSMDVDI